MSLPIWTPRVRRVVPLAVALISLVVPAVVGHTAGPTLTKELEYSPGDLSVSRSPAGARYSLPGALPWGETGEPEIPAVPVSIDLPPGDDVGGFELRVLSEHAFSPELAPWPSSHDPESPGTPDPSLYQSERYFPSKTVLYTGVGYARGRRIAMFVVHPLRVRPSNGDLTLATHAELIVHLKPSPEPGSEAVQPELPDRAARHDDASLGFAPTEQPSLEGSAVQMVIVCADATAAQFQRLADWKTRKGVPTVVRTVSWVRANYPEGVDLQARIRSFVRDAKELWGAKWLLLGGDTDVIPARYVLSRYSGEGPILSDLYYASLEGDWNADGDGFFGEARAGSAPGDSVDLYTDIYTGRLPASTEAEAQTLVDKLLAYEQSPPQAADFHRLLALGEVLFPSAWCPEGLPPSNDGAVYTDSTIHITSGYPSTRLYENYTKFPGSVRESRAAVLDSLNKGYNLVLHVGHGFRNTLAVGGGCSEDRVYIADADALHNGSREGVIYALNCSSAAVDYNCIAERFLLNPVGGACAYVGAADLDYPTTAFPFQLEFFNLLFRQGVTHVGETFALSNAPFVPIAGDGENAYRWLELTEVLLGDPEMDVWTSLPRPLAAAHVASMTLGQTTVQVTVTSSGSPVEGALVCLFKSGDAFAVDTTNASGIAQINVMPDSTGTLLVTATKHDYVPYTGSITVGAAAPGTPYLIVDSLPLTDPLGNGDGAANPGETVDLTLTVRNRGSSASGTVTATLTSLKPGVTVLQGSTTLEPIGAGQSGTASSAFLVSLPDSLADLEEVPLTVTMTSGSSWTHAVSLTVQAPQVGIFKMTVHDTAGSGNGDGVLDPGESVDVSLSFVNLGRGAHDSLEVRLRPVGGRVVISDSVATLGSLAAGGFGTPAPAFHVEVMPDSIPAAHLVVTDAGGTLMSMDLDFQPPSYPGVFNAVSEPTAIALSWTQPAASDVAGYYIYKSASSGGPFERINDAVDRMAYYHIEGLSELTRYYFRVVAVDRSGNFSPLSPVTSASTSAVLMPGWPVTVDGDATMSGPTFYDLDDPANHEGKLEIVSGGGHMYALEPDGEEYVDGDRNAITLGIFSGRALNVWCTPAIGDLDGDTSVEIVAQSWGERTVAGDESLFVFDGTFARMKPNWPQKIANYNWSSPAIGDISGDPKKEIVAVAGNRVYAWRANGVEVFDGDGDPTTNGVFAVIPNGTALYGSPALADLDGDGKSEIIVAERRLDASPTNQVYVYKGDGSNLSGFPKLIEYSSTSSPAVADLDGALDPAGIKPELIVATEDSVFVFNHDGSPFVGGPPRNGRFNYTNFGVDFMPSPAVGDLDLDGKLDIVIGTVEGVLFAWTGSTGQALPGFPVQISNAALNSAVIANLDDDPEMEILVGDKNGLVHGLNHDGTLLAGWPYKTENGVYGSPLVWDIDGNGSANVVIASSDEKIYVLDLPGVTFDPDNPADHPWPKFRHDVQNTGWMATAPMAVSLSSLSAQNRGGGIVDLSWEATSEYLEFRIYRQVDGGVEQQVGTVVGQAGEGTHAYTFADNGVPDGPYLYWIGAVQRDGGAEEKIGPLRVEVTTSGVPLVAELLQNAPNPFNPSTTIRYKVPASLDRSAMALRIFDVAGRVVRTLADGPQSVGEHSVTWDGRDDAGHAVSSGIYVYKLTGRGVTIARKMSLLQ